MTYAQVNMRMDAQLKAAGDAVLSEHGISVAHAIRSLWQYMADTRRVPDFVTSMHSSEIDGNRKAYELADANMALAARMAREAGILQELDELDYRDLRDYAYEQRLEEWERGLV
jgi:antitoxin component of RelBE/YafQ-DinJ toxin-antitoxin module